MKQFSSARVEGKTSEVSWYTQEVARLRAREQMLTLNFNRSISAHKMFAGACRGASSGPSKIAFRCYDRVAQTNRAVVSSVGLVSYNPDKPSAVDTWEKDAIRRHCNGCVVGTPYISLSTSPSATSRIIQKKAQYSCDGMDYSKVEVAIINVSLMERLGVEFKDAKSLARRHGISKCNPRSCSQTDCANNIESWHLLALDYIPEACILGYMPGTVFLSICQEHNVDISRDPKKKDAEGGKTLPYCIFTNNCDLTQVSRYRTSALSGKELSNMAGEWEREGSSGKWVFSSTDYRQDEDDISDRPEQVNIPTRIKVNAIKSDSHDDDNMSISDTVSVVSDNSSDDEAEEVDTPDTTDDDNDIAKDCIFD